MTTTETRAKELGAIISFEKKGIIASSFPTRHHKEVFASFLSEMGATFIVENDRILYTFQSWFKKEKGKTEHVATNNLS